MAKKGIKVLLVDDDDFLLEMYSVKFTDEGFDLSVAHNAEEAINELKKGDYSVVLLDIVMPKTDGLELLKQIKENRLATGALVMMLTNLGQMEDVKRGMSLGADDYIVKAHFTPSEVVERVMSHIK